MAASIKRVGDLRIDRDRRLVECDLSEAPDAAWRRIVENYDNEIPTLFFINLRGRGTTLTAEFPHNEQPANTLVEAIDKRIASANIRTGRAS